MTRPERDEFLDLYQRASAHLSQLRSTTPDAALDARLTHIVAEAHHALYGQRKADRKQFFRFFSETFPAAVWHIRRQILAAAILFFAPALIISVWIGVSDSAQDTIPPALAETYVNEDFESYYSSEAAAEFATTVFINNIWVSFLAFAVGIAFCVGTGYVLIANGVALGTAGGLFAASGELPKFFGLILPHGLLELTAIVVAGGAGFVLGWTVIDPGDRTRADALADEGRRSVVVVMGLILVFLAAAIIEGFVTGSPLSTLARVGIGSAAWVAFTLYVLVYGRRAAAHGLSGLWGDDRPRWSDAPVAELSGRATIAIAD